MDLHSSIAQVPSNISPYIPPYIIQARCELRVTDNSPSENTVTSWICTSDTIAEMNTKYAVALILALQVSMSLSEPSQELSEKYRDLRAVFLRRVQTALAKVRAYLSDSERATIVGPYIQALQSNPKWNAILSVAGGVVEEMSPLLDAGREKVLGGYEEHLRPIIGARLDTLINNVRPYLDTVLPVE